MVRAASAIAAVVLLGAAAAAGTTILEESLAQAVREAGCIVHGRITEVRTGRDERGIPATWVTIVATQVLKGANDPEVRFKQFGANDPLADGALPQHDVPRYARGQEVVLLLREASDWGFTSPVDVEHGVRVVESERAEAQALGTDAMGPTDLRAYLDTLAALVATQR